MIKFFLTYIILVFILLSCSSNPGNGPANGSDSDGSDNNDGSQGVSINIQYDWLTDYDMSNISGFNFQYINEAFEDVGITSTFTDENTGTLDSWSTYPNGYGSSDVFPDDHIAIKGYANFYHVSTFNWHFLSLNEFADAVTNGLSGNYIDNQTPDLDDRYSMVFIDNIASNYPQQLVSGIVTTSVHELGHQLAGLTHPSISSNSQYHHAIDFNEFDCVMMWNYGPTVHPKFCSITGNDYYYQTTNCKEILLNNLGGN